MPTLQFSIDPPLNASVQVGDTAHYIKINAVAGGFTTHQDNQQLVTIGTIRQITPVYNVGQGQVTVGGQDDTGFGSDGLAGTNPNQEIDSYKIECDISNSTPTPSNTNFIFFSKDRRVNENDAKGYYGEFTFKNSSRGKVELFATACEISESSK